MSRFCLVAFGLFLAGVMPTNAETTPLRRKRCSATLILVG